MLAFGSEIGFVSFQQIMHGLVSNIVRRLQDPLIVFKKPIMDAFLA